MPTDSNGVYSLPPGYLATTGGTIVTSQHNPIFEDLAASVTARLMATGANPMTGPLKHSDGSAAAPSMTFNTAGNAGFYKTTNGVGLAVGGVKVAEFTAAGIASGARYIGELFPYVGSLAPPPLCVFPTGQTLSRAAYPDLWTFAQTEIAAGNVFFNNGDGSTTFGIGDMRGRVPAASDPTGLVLGSNGVAIGTISGTDTHTLTLAQIPTGITSNNPSQAINVSTTGGAIVQGSVSISETPSGPQASWGGGSLTTNVPASGNNSIAVTSNNTSGQAHPNRQPTMITKFALFAGA